MQRARSTQLLFFSIWNYLYSFIPFAVGSRVRDESVLTEWNCFPLSGTIYHYQISPQCIRRLLHHLGNLLATFSQNTIHDLVINYKCTDITHFHEILDFGFLGFIWFFFWWKRPTWKQRKNLVDNVLPLASSYFCKELVIYTSCTLSSERRLQLKVLSKEVRFPIQTNPIEY